MTVAGTRESVQDLLQKLGRGGHNLKPLKDLFWTELNYDRVNDPLPCAAWPEHARDALADDPILFASAGAGDEFHVIYARLPSDALSLGAERDVITQLLRHHPYALFVFSNRQQTHWHFVNVKLDGQDHNRSLYRRIAVGPQERLRTATDRLSMLDLGSLSGDLFGISPLTIQKRHDEAFDVEGVTKKFFEHYARVFARVEGAIVGSGTADRKRLFAQRLFNRLMFIAFIEKKGWLTFDGDPDYLEALWKAHANTSPVENFYETRLKRLFFSGLNRPGGSDPRYKHLIGETPYLNGGLFEEDDDSRDPAIVVPNDAIDAILHDLFAPFNFTVTESTPLDVEVAVDPEMLGKVFESLVTGRHESGSYYTPKPVVSFMGREAIKGYLDSFLPHETTEAIACFVDGHDPEGLKNPEVVLGALRRIKICDPACGSGAYVLGLLQELLELRACLFARTKVDANTVYERKLEIIQNNVYGVDLDLFAVNIARLRLWLSLAVDHDENRPLPLPNLDFKIERGDSLTAPSPAGYDFSSILGSGFAPQRKDEQLQFVGMLPPKGVQLGFGDDQLPRYVERYLDAKREYLDAHAERKKELREEIVRLKAELMELPRKGVAAMIGFDWLIEFLEVFLDGGFDIILANPPYVRADAQFKHIQDHMTRQRAIDAWKKSRANLVSSGIYETLYEKWDVYLSFLERAYQLLRSTGQMIFIIPDAYNAAKYTSKSHEFFLTHTQVERIDFCSDIPLFDAGVKNTILHFSKRSASDEHYPTRARRWGDKPDDFEVNLEYLTTDTQRTLGESTFRPDGKVASVAYDAVRLEDICYISVGMVIHADEAKALGQFKAKDLISLSKDSVHPKHYLEGKYVARWVPAKARYLEWGTDRAPALFRRPTFPELYEAPEKAISIDIANGDPRVCYDDKQFCHNHSAWSFVPWHYLASVNNNSLAKAAKYNPSAIEESQGIRNRGDLEGVSRQFDMRYIVAVMNSRFARQYLRLRRRSNLHLFPDDWKPLPIPTIPMSEQEPIAELVRHILSLYASNGYPLTGSAAVNLKELEAEIDQHVDALFEKAVKINV